LSLNLSQEKALIITTDFTNYNCFKRMYLKCKKAFVLNFELNDERDFVFAIAKIPLNYKDEYHIRIIKTIYQSLTEATDCEIIGDHWIDIGFQDSDIKSDLRSVGMFGLIQLLSFIDRFLIYVKEVLFLSQQENNNFPLAIISLNLTYITLGLLRQGYLIKYCNYRMSVINTLNEFYYGLFCYFYDCYKSENLNYDDFPLLLKKITVFGQTNPSAIFEIYEKLSTIYPNVKDSMSLNENNNFD
jgi:hypothetical protein